MVERGKKSRKSRACWLCGAPALEAQRVCWQCGAELSPEMYAANARRGDDDSYGGDGYLPVPQTPGGVTDERSLPPAWVGSLPSRDRRAPLPPALSAVVNVLFAAGFGVLGALIGGGIWYLASTAIHFELGFLATLMGYLIGRGVVLGSTMRGSVPALLAGGITLFAYACWILAIHANGVNFNLLDVPFVLITLVVAMSPSLTRRQRET